MFNKKWLTTTYGPDFPVIQEEIGTLINQRYLKKIARKATQYELRMIAVQKITDQRFLIMVSQSDTMTGVRLAALERIEDRAERLKAARSVIEDQSNADHYRIEAIKTVLHDYPKAQSDLREIISHAEPGDILRAADLLDDADTAQKAYLRVVLESDSTDEQVRAINHITDQRVLIDLAEKIIHGKLEMATSKTPFTYYGQRSPYNGEMAMAAADRIEDAEEKQKAYQGIAREWHFDEKYRYKAALNISDIKIKTAAMEDIMKTAEARIPQKSGTYYWEDKTMVSIVKGCKEFLSMISEVSYSEIYGDVENDSENTFI